MAPRISRRAFLVGIGGGVASVSLAFGLWKYAPRAPIEAGARYPVMTGNVYVDYAGWIVTPADKARLTATGSIRLMNDTVLSGDTLGQRTLESADACAAWCLQEPDCQGFSFASAEHPDRDVRRTCSLRQTSQITPTANPNFISGIRSDFR